MKYKIAIVTPEVKNDYLTDTLIDGLVSLKNELDLEFYAPEGYPCRISDFNSFLPTIPFFDFTERADLILFCWGKGNTNYELINRINRFNQTVFIDGSEVGGNRRFDSDIQKQLLERTYDGNGKVDKVMLKKCALYFKREKPYMDGIIPFPFGIERRYRRHYSEEVKKDTDFFCVFGQDEYPVLRREVRVALEEFCKKNNFSFFTEKTDQENFYKVLAKSKVGISVGGGGYDTARFWEILGNNCLLLTEKIDIYEEGSDRLKFRRMWQFKDLMEFKSELEKVANFLKTEYKKEDLRDEYETILSNHSSKARVLEILEKAREKGIIGKS